MVLPDHQPDPRHPDHRSGLNAPTGAWCFLTALPGEFPYDHKGSQCTYRCVVLPDFIARVVLEFAIIVSMHLQVRGAP